MKLGRRDIEAKLKRLSDTAPGLDVHRENSYWVADYHGSDSCNRLTAGLSTREMYHWLSAFETGRSLLYNQLIE